ncbi:hypothetical protein MFLAVUS_001769 [Mucor flavus]|uniref:Uncharacterized protein n=1 Tax=Mucor flavus TaxID=439312 RepID=A0ABP9YNE5_9FUNG
MMSAVAYVKVRKIDREPHFMARVIYFGLVSVVISPISMYLFQNPVMPQGSDEYGMLLLVGLQRAPAGPGTLMRMNDAVFAFLSGIFILHEHPDIYSISGASIIVLMTSAIGIHKFVGRPNALGCVRCFLCNVKLSDWQPKQSPFLRHGNESPHSAWKRLNFPDAHKRPLSDPTKAFNTPRTEKYPTAAKLAGAGFYFSPADLPSRAKCAYCGVSITINPNDTDLLSLSISPATDNTPPPTKKPVLQRLIDITETTSTPVVRDKGKGRQIKFNLPSSLLIEAISLSRSRNKLPESATSSISKEPLYIPYAEGSGASRQHPIYTQSARVIQNVTLSNISQDTQDVSPMNQDTPGSSPITTQDTTEVSNLLTGQVVAAHATLLATSSFWRLSTLGDLVKKKYTNTSGQTLLTVKDTQYVSFSLMPSDTEDELRPPSPVRNDDGSLDDKENVPPNITYSPVREYYKSSEPHVLPVKPVKEHNQLFAGTGIIHSLHPITSS